MHRSLRLVIVWAALVCGVAAGGDEPHPVAGDAPAAPPAGTAADGTASVVVPAVEAPATDTGSGASSGGPAVDAVPSTLPPRTPAAPPPGDEPARDGAAASAGSGAAELLVAVLEPLEAAQELYARPLSLLEAIQRPGDPARRLWIAQAYWKVSASHAWVRWAAEAVERLDLVAPGADPHDRAVLDVAAAAARADLAEARSQLGVAQQELVDLARLPITEPPPWPVDRPLATPYQTHFDVIFATRMATGRTRAIARTLPARHEALEARAAAVAAAGRAMAMAEADHAKGRRPIEAVVAAHAALVGQQREFLGAVRAYNLDIAEYAMAAADLSVPDDRFVSMLIGTPIAVRPASGPTPAGGAAP